MASILIKPTDENDPDYQSDLVLYNNRIESVRRILSTDISMPINSEDIPEDVLADDYFIDEAEDQILQDLDIEASDVDESSQNYSRIIRLLQLRLAINFIPQLSQILSESVLNLRNVYQEIDWEKRMNFLEQRYSEQAKKINPSYESPTDYPVHVVSTYNKDRKALTETSSRTISIDRSI